LERISESFLFHGTAEIPSDINICLVYSVFRGIHFFGNYQPYGLVYQKEHNIMAVAVS
jgi:hypothetical protein